ncbi:hypothetical protein [Halalkalicoccus tibetensis]|uniref:Uncharacterized protein n=1 Tax=Halalkalicoccus tibetensis TaxID=175632 RepID=A0ABD5V9I5_9EURY
MPGELMDRGQFLSLQLIGIEYIDMTLNMYNQDMTYSGLLIGVVVENHSDETCEWDQSALEFIDTNGFTYRQRDTMKESWLDEVIPGGWHADLRELKPNRKYRLLTFVADFHSELGVISFEEEARYLLQTMDWDNEQVERIEIDVSHLSENNIGSLPEIVDAFAKHS